MTSKLWLMTTCAFGAVATLSAAASNAQSVSSDTNVQAAGSSDVTEIVVTAQKRLHMSIN